MNAGVFGNAGVSVGVSHFGSQGHDLKQKWVRVCKIFKSIDTTVFIINRQLSRWMNQNEYFSREIVPLHSRCLITT